MAEMPERIYAVKDRINGGVWWQPQGVAGDEVQFIRADLVDELVKALETFRDYGCPVCHGDCASANPPVNSCPMQMAHAALAKRDEEVARMRGVLTRCRTILGNMAKENEGAIFYRWPISHEPLRADARHLLPIIDEALTKEPTNAE